ncbi:hypothetical protein QJS04_geneDACA022501 [Acorus gramineus]|uniref:Ribonuclease H1 N-terminal domain-containing protein n=1 Tax=Acorus gramineus TaxID=55184 RepID=A0AAV8ZYS9_ACOGR|nr:hypothetical protein QJS04_geneDACA022501 [Acorus gramineus]
METISRHFNAVLKAMVSLRREYINLPQNDVQVHPHVRHNKIFFPYLKVVVGWEGSTADMKVLRWALESRGVSVPEGACFHRMENYPYYAVTKGRRPGVYDNWAAYHAQVHRFKGATFMGVQDIEEGFTLISSVNVGL